MKYKLEDWTGVDSVKTKEWFEYYLKIDYSPAQAHRILVSALGPFEFLGVLGFRVRGQGLTIKMYLFVKLRVRVKVKVKSQN